MISSIGILSEVYIDYVHSSKVLQPYLLWWALEAPAPMLYSNMRSEMIPSLIFSLGPWDQNLISQKRRDRVKVMLFQMK